MTFLQRSLVGFALGGLTLALGACASDPNDQTVASARGIAPDCPVGTMLCRHRNAGAATSSVSADALREQGVTSVGTPEMRVPTGGGR